MSFVVSPSDKIQEIFDSVPAIIWSADPHTLAFTYVSRGAESILGYPVEEWTSDPGFFINHLHPDDRGVIHKCRGAVEAVRNHELIYRMIAADGRIVWLRDAVTVKAGTSGIELYGAMIDITAERENLRSEERLQLLAAGTSEAIWEVDFSTNSFWANDAYRSMFGTPTTLEEAFAIGVERLHPEDRDVTVDRVARRLDGTLDHWSDEYRIRRLNGEFAWVLDRGRLIRSEEGRPARLIGAILDITPLREAELRYRQIFEEVQDVIYTLDAEARITSLNPAFEKTTGYRVEDWIGRPMKDILTPESGPRAFEHFSNAIANVDAGARQYQMNNAAGGLLDIEASGKALVVNSRVVGTIGIVRDVTERNLLQRGLEAARRIASLGQLAASVAHEFNNVLMSVQPFVELLLKTSAGSGHSEIARKHITEAIARGKRVTSEILLYANPKEPQLEALDASSWLGSMVISLRATLPDKIRIEAIPSDVSILCDRYHLEQVIANLATNARDAMPDGGTFTLEIALDAGRWRNRVALRPGVQYARLTVIDNGAGISAEVLSHIWEPLFTTKRAGTGLGLPIAKRLIERQNGVILIDSTEGRGTMFHIFLPVAAGAKPPQPADEAAPRAPLRRVVLVEDDESVAVGLGLMFELEGVECLRIADGERALDIIREFDPQIVVLDIHLPGISGLEVAARVREMWPLLPIILSTGHMMELDLGPKTSVILKPYMFEELLERCHEALRG
ncbi:MAG: PAS domain-containing hybrid sensor histidine kinase/response regulator [Thermoanaerobaculia bacterium]